jgi:CheY-like chemotaxis protein
MLSRIFDLFAQERQSLDRSQGGLGLGLAIVKNLVEMHGGQVHARSGGPGHGSEFEVVLPLCQVWERAPSSSPSLEIASPSARRWKVMVVDDNSDTAEMLAVGLTALGYEVQVAHDGLSALSLAEWFRPDVGLLDLGLPVMDGYELARRLRAGGSEAPLLLAVTGYGCEQDRERSRAAGFQEHMAKPVAIADVRAMLETLRARVEGKVVLEK